MKKKKRTIVSAILISKDEKVLLGKVREGGVYPDCWHIPGGGVDDGETKQHALFREIQEETGIDINVSLDDDLSEYRWVSLDDIPNYKHTPPSKRLFEKLGWLKK